MVVVGGEERLDGDQPIGTGTIFDHHRFSPTRRQAIRKEPCADIDARAGTERHQEFHRPLRPGLRLRVRLRRQQRDHPEQGEDQRTQLRYVHEYPHGPDDVSGR